MVRGSHLQSIVGLPGVGGALQCERVTVMARESDGYGVRE
jgi:hypothetical protein